MTAKPPAAAPRPKKPKYGWGVTLHKDQVNRADARLRKF